jgi:hypothetical protein
VPSFNCDESVHANVETEAAHGYAHLDLFSYMAILMLRWASHGTGQVLPSNVLIVRPNWLKELLANAGSI